MAIPKYASEISAERRIKYHCRAGCSKTVYGELELTKHDADKLLKLIQQENTAKRELEDSDLGRPVNINVICGVCGYKQGDRYNWTSEFFDKS